MPNITRTFFSELHQQGTLIPQNDITVAATARKLNFEVLVGPNDEAHFRRIEGLGVRVFPGKME